MLITAILLALAVAATGIRIWIKGSFADTEIGHNENMRKKGIVCAREEEIRLLHGDKTVSEDCSACLSCLGKSSCFAAEHKTISNS